MSVIIFFLFLGIFSQLFNEPLFTRKGLSNFFTGNKCSYYLCYESILLYIFSPKGNTFASLFFMQFFIFISRAFRKSILKSTSGTNFFPKVFNHKRSLISHYELLFQRCMVIYDVNESVG